MAWPRSTSIVRSTRTKVSPRAGGVRTASGSSTDGAGMPITLPAARAPPSRRQMARHPPDAATLLHSDASMNKDEGMRRRPAAALVASLVLLVLAAGVPGWLPATAPSTTRNTPTASAALDALASLPLGFEPNVGPAPA